MREQEEIVVELQRVARLLASNRVSQDDYEKHGSMSVSGICYVFGSWNRAIVAAGLEPYDPSTADRPKTEVLELMEEIIRVTVELGKRPSDREMASFGKFSPKPYVKRWGTFAKGREAAYEALGFPQLPEKSNK